MNQVTAHALNKQAPTAQVQEPKCQILDLDWLSEPEVGLLKKNLRRVLIMRSQYLPYFIYRLLWMVAKLV
jgi:hypothetical protein